MLLTFVNFVFMQSPLTDQPENKKTFEDYFDSLFINNNINDTKRVRFFQQCSVEIRIERFDLRLKKLLKYESQEEGNKILELITNLIKKEFECKKNAILFDRSYQMANINSTNLSNIFYIEYNKIDYKITTTIYSP